MENDYRGLRGINKAKDEGKTFGYTTVRFDCDNPDFGQIIEIYNMSKIAYEKLHHERVAWLHYINRNLAELRNQ